MGQVQTNIDLYSKINLNWTSQDEEFLKIALDAHSKSRIGWFKWLEHHYPEVVDWLWHRHPLLTDSYNIATHLYWLEHKFVEFPRCKVCGKPMSKDIDSFNEGYFRACNPLCAAKDPQRKEKYQNTCLDRYGSSNYLASKYGKEKRDLWLASQGVTNAFQLESVKEKSKKSRKDHFGYEFTMQSPEKRKLASDNYKKKTGYAHQFYNPNVKKKINQAKKNTIASGIDPRKKFKQNWRIRRYNSIASLSTEVFPLFSLEYFMQFDRIGQYHILFDWHCNKCGKDFKAYLDQNLIQRSKLPARCPVCHPISNGTSRYEYEIADFLVKSCGITDVKMHDRDVLNPYEIDISIPSKMIGFEFDGLFFHSETNGGKDKAYHVFKTDMAKNNGYQLFHIFEDEWLNHRQLVESRIRSICGKPKERFFARKCCVREIDDIWQVKDFLNCNHLQGWCTSKVNYGLFYEGHLIAMMTFGKPRYNKSIDWELLRYCSKIDTQVLGGAGKLLSAFEKAYHPKVLLSYADRRWSFGKMYESLGFSLDHISSPNYWYLKTGICKRFSRIDFQKHKLKSILPKFDASLTEVENMQANGYDRIFDCGNFVYLKSYI